MEKKSGISWRSVLRILHQYKFHPYKKVIQMTATGGLTILHSINPIFQYISDCLSKSKRYHSEADAPTTSVFLVRILVSLGHFSLKMSKEPPLQTMTSVTVPRLTNFCFEKLKKMTWTTFGFIRMGPLATQPT